MHKMRFLLLLTLTSFLLPGTWLISQENPNRLEPEYAIENLELYPGLEATLFASEPTISSVTNLDIDHRGRVWVCEVMNYREHGRKNTRPEGDRILILEDEDGDGVADTSKTYYQGRDVDAALGICVLGNQVIVTCAPNVILFTDEDGDDKPDRKEYLFTNTGKHQDDHSAHAFVYGPDGKLYWNMGNHGKFVHDREGNLVIDQAGNPVFDKYYSEELANYEAKDTPYWGGMIFRCNPDGSGLETLAHNFRNNYEVAIDSFGGLWQSDNDDDGYFGCRLNYILEYGNYGYRDELTGAGWRTPRVSQHPEIPRRHWHQNDPGVVPNFVQTGAGSPTCITVYEGDLLPEVFHNQVLHCEAGPGVVWAVIAEPDGAGFQGNMVTLLKETKRGWVRPVDVATAPDGSIFISDWYDPVVSWNRQWDVPRGRIYRVAPSGHRYRIKSANFSSPSAASKGLTNPNSDVRYLARQALINFPTKDTLSELGKLFRNTNSRIRARALWLLAKLEGEEKASLYKAITDPDKNIRVTAIRAARQYLPNHLQYLEKLVDDSSPRVRSEIAIALRNLQNIHVPDIWTHLANQLDATDRWNLEALGIAADGRWNDCLNAWQRNGGDWKSAAGRKIIWRSRGDQTPEFLVKCLGLESLEMDEIRMLLRAFDFQAKSPAKQKALRNLAYHGWKDHTEAGWLISSEAFQRLKDSALSQTAPFQQRLDVYLSNAPVNEAYISLVGTFGKTEHLPALLDTALAGLSSSLQISALRALFDAKQSMLIEKTLMNSTHETRASMVQLLADSRDDRAIPFLSQVLLDSDFPLEQRRKATRALGVSRGGSVALVRLARENRFPEEMKQEAGRALTQTLHVNAYAEAAQYFPIPKMKGTRSMPGMTDLVVLFGNRERGKEVFQKASCATCHQIHGKGINFGPDLSAIGAKLAKTGLYESILDPNAGVSEAYQTVTLELKDGTSNTGFLVSETAQSLTLRIPGGVDVTHSQSEIAQLTKFSQSLMPTGLEQLMTLDDLVDLAEYLSSLK